MIRLRFDNKTIDKVSLLVYEHMSRFDKLRNPNLKKFINRIGIQNLEDLFTLQIADVNACAEEFHDITNVLLLKEKCETIINENQPLSLKDLLIDGNDLINMGITEGRKIGDILRDLLNMVLEEPELNNPEKLKGIVKQLFKEELKDGKVN